MKSTFLLISPGKTRLLDISPIQSKIITMTTFFSTRFIKFPLLGALLAQVLSLFLIKTYIQLSGRSLDMVPFLFFQATASAIISQFLFKLPKWFFYISFLTPIVFVLAANFLHVSSWIYGGLFLFFAMTFSHTLKERVPLYLTNKKTHEALKKMASEREAQTFLDLGSGLGGVVRALAENKISSTGVESAPLLWVCSSLLSLVTFRGKILRQNIWNTNLQNFDVVYAFLSPAIMDKLYQKVRAEMRAGTVFISNSFQVVGVEPDEVWQLTDERATKLYIYKIKS